MTQNISRFHHLLGTSLMVTLLLAAGAPALAGINVEVNLSSGDLQAAEAGQDVATFTVTRAASSSQPLTVNLDIGGSATRNVDYSLPGVFGGAPLAISIPANQTSAQFTLTPRLDNVAEGPETIDVTVQSGSGYVLGTNVAVQLTLADDVPEVNLTLLDGAMAEQGLDPGSFSVSRTNNGNIAQPITVNIDIAGTAVRNVDYSSTGIFGGAPLAVSIPANELQATFELVPRVDNQVEGDETITVTLQPNAAVYTVGAQTQADLVIADDVPEVNLSLVDGAMAENGQDPGTFRVTRSNNGNITQAITVNIDITGTAQRNIDYTSTGVFGGAPLAVSIPANALEATFDLVPRVDNVVEGDETITVTLQPGASVYTVGTQTQADFTLADDVPTVNLTLIDGEMNERDLDPGSFLLTRSNNGNIMQPISVNIEFTGTAQRNVDYTSIGVFGGAPLAVSIPANELELTVVLTPRADNPDDEGDETIEVTLQPGATYTVGTQTTALLTLGDFLEAVFADSFEAAVVPKSCDLGAAVKAMPEQFFDQGASILDLEDGLIWARCGLDGWFDWASHSCATPEGHTALSDTRRLALFNQGLIGDNSGFQDWRLPSRAELRALGLDCGAAVRTD